MKIFKRLIYKIFKGIVIEELLKDIHKKHIKEQEEIYNQYAEFDFDEFYRKSNEEDYTEELKEQGVNLTL